MHEAQELADTALFEATNLLIMCLLLVLALLLGRVLHRHHISSLTESGLFIAVGVLFGGLMYILVENGAAGREAMQHFFFNHELFNLSTLQLRARVICPPRTCASPWNLPLPALTRAAIARKSQRSTLRHVRACCQGAPSAGHRTRAGLLEQQWLAAILPAVTS